MARKRVVIGFLGTTLDIGKQQNRWQRWRPTVALCQHEDFLVDRLELIHAPALRRDWRSICAATSPASRPRPKCASTRWS